MTLAEAFLIARVVAFVGVVVVLAMSIVRRVRRSVASSSDLKPGPCECGHNRCSHKRGTGSCTVEFPADAKSPEGTECACEIYIRDDGPEPDPAVFELERMYKK